MRRPVSRHNTACGGLGWKLFKARIQPGEYADITVSCDGTWQKRGFTSLYGACFVVNYHTGKMLDYEVTSKYCVGCRSWERRDQTSLEYTLWQASHIIIMCKFIW